MQKIHRPLIAAAALSCALAPAAQAATKTVDLGLAKPPKGVPEAASLTAFFPKTVKVNVGDKVSFRLNSFGSIYIARKAPGPWAAPDLNQLVSGAKDPAGNDFWFNGQPSAPIDPFFLQATGDKKITGKGVDHSGLPLSDGPPPPYVATFTKTGSFKIRNGLLPAVAAKVVVVPKGRKVPSAAADQARAAKQAAKAVREAKRLAGVNLPENTIRLGNDSKNVTFYRFFRGAETIKAGQPLTVEAGRFSGDIHNLVIGPMPYLESTPPFLDSPQFALNPIALYPSQPPTAPLTFDGTQNGGFVNTGALDADSKTLLPKSKTLTITKAGAYTYYCQFHGPDMNGTITVE